MMSVFEKMCSISIVLLLNWCQCLRRCAQFLLCYCWIDVSVWEDLLNFYCLTVWDDILDVHCLTVEIMTDCEKMYSISIVQLLKWCQCGRICTNFYCPTVEMMSVFQKMCSILLSNCWNDVSVWEYLLISIVQLLKWCQCLRRYANFYCPTVEMMSVFQKMC